MILNTYLRHNHTPIKASLVLRSDHCRMELNEKYWFVHWKYDEILAFQHGLRVRTSKKSWPYFLKDWIARAGCETFYCGILKNLWQPLVHQVRQATYLFLPLLPLLAKLCYNLYEEKMPRKKAIQLHADHLTRLRPKWVSMRASKRLCSSTAVYQELI